MTRFLTNAVAFAEDEILRMKSLARYGEELCRSKGKNVDIELVLIENLGFEFSCHKSISRPATRDFPLRGGKYTVLVSRGALVKMCYMYEIFTYCWSRCRKELRVSPQVVFVHSQQEDQGSTHIPIGNMFDLDLHKALFENFDRSTSIHEACENFEQDFWPFVFSETGLSEAAKLFVSRAVEFLFMHEVGHIAAGHFEYIEDQIGLCTSFNAFSVATKSHVHREIQAMELSADHTAVQNFISNGFFDSKVEDDMYLSLEIFLASIAFLFSSSDLSARTISTYSQAEHPDADLRFYLIFDWLRVLLWERRPELPDQSSQRSRDLARKVVHWSMRSLREVGVGGGGFSLLSSKVDDDDISRWFEEESMKLARLLIQIQSQCTERVGASSDTAPI